LGMAAGSGGFSSAVSVGVGAAYSAIKSAGQAERVAVGSGKAAAQEGGPDGAVLVAEFEGSLAAEPDSRLAGPGGGDTKMKAGPRLIGNSYKEADPGDLVDVDKYGSPWAKGAQGHFKLHREAAGAVQELIAAARSAGQDVSIGSAYRTPQEQAKKWADAVRRYGSEKEARIWVAQYSEHSSGRAVDFNLDGLHTTSAVAKSGAFERSPATLWVRGYATAANFTPYKAEPWHWSYNPVPQ